LRLFFLPPYSPDRNPDELGLKQDTVGRMAMTSMANDDARSLDHKTLESLRIRAVRSVQAGESPSSVAQLWVSPRGKMYGRLAHYRRGGWGGLNIPPRRPPAGKPCQPIAFTRQMRNTSYIGDRFDERLAHAVARPFRTSPKLAALPARTASLPVNRCQRSTITSQ
jgi:hypothetical protein